MNYFMLPLLVLLNAEGVPIESTRDYKLPDVHLSRAQLICAIYYNASVESVEIHPDDSINVICRRRSNDKEND